MNFKTLYEARRNPEQNPKFSTWDIIKKYLDKGDENIFLTFSNIPKIGINPKSEWSTPSGFYAYQIDSWGFYGLDVENSTKPLSEIFPYAGDRKYLIFTALKNSAIVLKISSYTMDNYEQDVLKIREYMLPLISESMLDFIQARAEQEAYKQHAFSYLWNYTRLLSKFILKKRIKQENSDYEEYDINVHRNINKYKFPIPSRRSAIWNKLLMVCGYDAIIDDVAGSFIDVHEKKQTVILNLSTIQILSIALNKFSR